MSARHVFVALMLAAGFVLAAGPLAQAAEAPSAAERVGNIEDLYKKMNDPRTSDLLKGSIQRDIEKEAEALAELGQDAANALLNKIISTTDDDLRLQLLIALKTVGEGDARAIGVLQVQRLAKELKAAKHYPSRYWIVKCLAQSNVPQAIDPLVEVLAGKDAFTARIVLRVLVEKTVRTAAKDIVPMLSHEDVQLRVQAVLALKVLGGQPQVDDVIGLLSDANITVRLAAVDALEALTKTEFGIIPQDSKAQIKAKIDAWLQAHQDGN